MENKDSSLDKEVQLINLLQTARKETEQFALILAGQINTLCNVHGFLTKEISLNPISRQSDEEDCEECVDSNLNDTWVGNYCRRVLEVRRMENSLREDTHYFQKIRLG